MPPERTYERFELHYNKATWPEMAVALESKLKQDTHGGCSVCGYLPVVNVSGTYWLCGSCVAERLDEIESGTKVAEPKVVDDERHIETVQKPHPF